jgi:Ca2+-binding EF-hand superfamily protein
VGSGNFQETSSDKIIERFKQFDRNVDGKLSREELPPNWFNQLDINKYSFVTINEARKIFQKEEKRYLRIYKENLFPKRKKFLNRKKKRN